MLLAVRVPSWVLSTQSVVAADRTDGTFRGKRARILPNRPYGSARCQHLASPESGWSGGVPGRRHEDCAHDP